MTVTAPPWCVVRALGPIRQKAALHGYEVLRARRGPVWEVRDGDRYALLQWDAEDKRFKALPGNDGDLLAWVRSLLSNP